MESAKSCGFPREIRRQFAASELATSASPGLPELREMICSVIGRGFDTLDSLPRRAKRKNLDGTLMTENLRGIRRLTTPLPLCRLLRGCSPSFKVFTWSFTDRSCFGESDLELEAESSESGGVSGYSGSESDVYAVVLSAAANSRARISKDSLERTPARNSS